MSGLRERRILIRLLPDLLELRECILDAGAAARSNERRGPFSTSVSPGGVVTFTWDLRESAAATGASVGEIAAILRPMFPAEKVAAQGFAVAWSDDDARMHITAGVAASASRSFVRVACQACDWSEDQRFGQPRHVETPRLGNSLKTHLRENPAHRDGLCQQIQGRQIVRQDPLYGCCAGVYPCRKGGKAC